MGSLDDPGVGHDAPAAVPPGALDSPARITGGRRVPEANGAAA